MSGEPDVAETTARYLADELNAADAAAFEARLAADPRVYRDIDAKLRLKEGLAVLRDRGELAPLTVRDRRRLFAAAAVAAAIALLIGVAWLSRTAPRGPVVLARAAEALLDASGKPLPVALRATLMRTRGDAHRNQLALPGTRSAIELALAPSSADGATRYDILLERRESRGSVRIAEIRGVSVDATGFVDVFVDASALRPGTYGIALQAEGAPGGDEIAFAVVPAARP
jgi:hypothetical protein